MSEYDDVKSLDGLLLIRIMSIVKWKQAFSFLVVLFTTTTLVQMLPRVYLLMIIFVMHEDAILPGGISWEQVHVLKEWFQEGAKQEC